MVEKRRHLRHHLKPFFASQRLDAISTFTVDRYERRLSVPRAKTGMREQPITPELARLLRKRNDW
jgi:hypothetical protein